MAVGLTQPVTEMSTRNLPEGKGRRAHKADNLTAICEPFIYQMLEPQHLTSLWAFMAYYRDIFIFTITFAFTLFSQFKNTDKNL
jgi:hypothetical protein